jgi:glutaminase
MRSLIATTSLIKGNGATERLNRMLNMFRRYIGHDVFVHISVFTSERSTGHRNRAMAHLMLNFGMIDRNIEESLFFVLPAMRCDGKLLRLSSYGSECWRIKVSIRLQKSVR